MTDRPRVTYREILVLFLPLAATSTMMSLSGPIINAGLARLPDPEVGLAAFGLAFTLSILLESPVFALQQAIVAWYRGTGSVRPYLRFGLALGLVMAGWMVIVAWSPLAPFILQRLLGADRELTRPAVEALRISVLFPPLIAVRSAFQAVLIGRRRAAPIAVGTLVRLVFLAVAVFLVVPRYPEHGPAAATAALAVAVLLETVFTGVLALGTPEIEIPSSPAHAQGDTGRGRILFLLPLAWTMTLGTLTNPLINAFIARGADPKTGLAVFAVVSSLMWFLASSVLRFSTVTIALGTTKENLQRLQRFLWWFVGGVCTAVLLLTATPASRVLLEDILGLTPELAARARLPLFILSLQPLVAGFIAYTQGILTRAARTQVIGIGSISRTVAILGLGLAGTALGLRGGLLGAILLGAAFAAELFALLAMRERLRRRKLRAIGS